MTPVSFRSGARASRSAWLLALCLFVAALFDAPAPAPAQAVARAGSDAALQKRCAAGGAADCLTLGIRQRKAAGQATAQPKPGDANIRRGIALSKAACDAKQATACVGLGDFYRTSTLVEYGSWKETAKLYETACALKGMQGCNNWGQLFSSGYGVPSIRAIAIQLFIEACEGNNADACFNLGRAFSSGPGATRDASRAMVPYEKACEIGHLVACLRLADLYFSDEDRASGNARAEAVLSSACKKGALDGCISLASRRLSGRGLPQDTAGGKALYAATCRRGSAQACFDLGSLYLAGEQIGQDKPTAAAYFAKACDAGSAESCEKHGKMLYAGDGIATDKPAAIALFNRACTLQRWVCDRYRIFSEGPKVEPECTDGTLTSCATLADIYATRDTLAYDFGLATTTYQKACDGGLFSACASLAKLYEDASGNEEYPARARLYHAKACDGKVAEACKTLGGYYGWNRDPPDEALAARYFSAACAAGDEDSCLQRDHFVGVAPEVQIAQTDSQFGPPLDPDDPANTPPPGTICTENSYLFRGKIYKEMQCVGAAISGVPIPPGSAPWQALIERPALVDGRPRDARSRVLCGASLVAKGWLVTAAHCLYVGGADIVAAGYTIKLGAYDVSREDEGIRYPIIKVMPHRNFTKGDKRFANDIALIQYDARNFRKLGRVNTVRSIRLDRQAMKQRLILAGMRVYSYGWGWTEAENSQVSDVLRGIRMELKSAPDCTRITGFTGLREDIALCASAANGAQACYGDSGGPLVYYGDADHVPTLIGVVSAGKACGTTGRPSQYTRVAASLDWILPIINAAPPR